MSDSRSRLLADRARRMRSDPTPTEARFFAAVRGGRLGVRFKRQVVVGRYIVDFLAPSLGLVVEIDGGYHSRFAHRDAQRDLYLARRGFTVLHISDEMVRCDLPRVVALVREAVSRLEGA